MWVKFLAVLLAVFLMFEGPNAALVAAMDAVGSLIPLQMSVHSDWLYPLHRSKRSFKMHLSEKDMRGAQGFAEGVVERLARHEQSLMWGKVVPQMGSSSYTAMVASWADNTALARAKQAYINAKASSYLANKNCIRYGMSSSYCADQLTRLTKVCPNDNSCKDSPYRSLDGSCNNQLDAQLGSMFSPYSRILPPTYDDGIWMARGGIKRLMNPLTIANTLEAAEVRGTDATLATVAWGNMVAHDLAHTVSNRMMNTGENIMCCSEHGSNLAPRHRHPLCLQLQDKQHKCVNYVRSMLSNSHQCQLGPAQQMNAVSHFLDGSSIYGNTEEISANLRSFNNGKLKMDTSGHGPVLLKTKGMKWHNNSSLYLSGDVRINMDAMGAILHTLLVREHNRLATLLLVLNPHWNDETLFQEARRILIAEIQHITYNEWLSVILGETAIAKQSFLQLSNTGVYNKNADPSVLNGVANGAMKFISSMVADQIGLYSEERNFEKSILNREALVRPEVLEEEGSFDSVIRGFATQGSQAPDLTYSEAVAKYFYSAGNTTGMNAFSLDIQRGRDHGIPPFAEFRKLFGLNYESFDKLSDTIPKPVITKLKKVYNKVSEIDLLVGGMAEKPLEGGLLGPVFSNLVSRQFVLTRVADRYFYDNEDQPKPFTPEQLSEIRKSSLARLLCDNGDVIKNMQPRAFIKPNSKRNRLNSCSDLPEVDLKPWQEGNSLSL